MFKKLIIAALLAFILPGAALATQYTGTAQVPSFGLFGTIDSAADTTLTLSLNGGYVTGVVVLTQTIADSSVTTPSLGSGTMSDGTTLTLSINPSSATETEWIGTIVYSDSEVAGTLGLDAVTAAATPADYSVVVSEIASRFGGVGMIRIAWESDDAGDTTGTVQMPPGLIKSARFISNVTPTNLYDATLKDASAYDVLLGLGADIASASTVTKNPATLVFNASAATMVPVAVSYGSHQLLITNAGADKSGFIELTIGD